MDYELRASRMTPHLRIEVTVRSVLATVQAAMNGELAGDMNKRVLAYMDVPYAQYYNEPQYSLFERMIIYRDELYTASGKRNMLALLAITNAPISTLYKTGFTARGVGYKGITGVKDIERILLQEIPVNTVVCVSDEYAYEGS